jgi:antitoxin ParD1/3/4
MPTRNVNLTEHFDRFIEAGITSGRFSNASEVVREGLRLLEQREREDQAKIEWLRAAAKEGFDDIECGDYVTLRLARRSPTLSIDLEKRLQPNSQASSSVPERRSRRLEVRLTRTAQRDVKAILNWSRKEFGEAAAARYKALIKQALRDMLPISSGPDRRNARRS